MSRSNHYRLCEDCTVDELCERHSSWSGYRYYNHKPVRLIAARRPWTRKSRYPIGSIKRFMGGPPRWWWQEQHSRARAIYRRMMRDEDPALPREQELIDLWGWY